MMTIAIITVAVVCVVAGVNIGHMAGFYHGAAAAKGRRAHPPLWFSVLLLPTYIWVGIGDRKGGAR